MKARVSQLHNTEKEWLKLSTWKPEAGEIVVYDPDDTYKYSRLKVGDGKHTLQELGFFVDAATESILQQHKTLDAGRITDY